MMSAFAAPSNSTNWCARSTLERIIRYATGQTFGLHVKSRADCFSTYAAGLRILLSIDGKSVNRRNEFMLAVAMANLRYGVSRRCGFVAVHRGAPAKISTNRMAQGGSFSVILK